MLSLLHLILRFWNVEISLQLNFTFSRVFYWYFPGNDSQTEFSRVFNFAILSRVLENFMRTKKHHCFTIAVGLLQRLIQARWPSYHYGRLQQGTSAIVSLSLLQSPTQICRLRFRQKHFVGGNRTSLVAGSNRMFQQIFCTVCTVYFSLWTSTDFTVWLMTCQTADCSSIVSPYVWCHFCSILYIVVCYIILYWLRSQFHLSLIAVHFLTL